MDIRPEPQIVEITDFNRISDHYDTFFWHFILENHNAGSDVSLKSLYLEETESMENNHALKELQETLGLTIFESYTKDSVDFLNNFGIPFNKIYNNKTKRFFPFFCGFKNKNFKGSTNLTTGCHCIAGVTEIVYQTDPKIFESFSELGVKEEDLK